MRHRGLTPPPPLPLPSPPPRSEGRELLLRNYQRGRKVHWSGFSSASPSREVASQFAGAGGVLLRLDLLPQCSGASDIRNLSALRAEEEASRAPCPRCSPWVSFMGRDSRPLPRSLFPGYLWERGRGPWSPRMLERGHKKFA